MSRDLWLLALKAVLAGTFVVLFSLVAEVLRPKLFSGLFAGAPVVAAVSLAITAAVKPAAARQGSLGMLAGAAGMIACCALAARLIPRTGAWVGSALAWATWAVVAIGLYLLLLA